MNKNLTAPETFWLVHRAHNRLIEPMKDLKAIEPTARIQITAVLEAGTVSHRYPTLTLANHVVIAVHWERDGMPLHAYNVTTPEQVEVAAQQLERFTAGLPDRQLPKEAAA